jgi:ABC-type uncharacterized transport system permease subunit
MSNRPICGTDTPDPWLVAAHGKFYLTFTLGNRVEIWQSAQLENFWECQKSVIWVSLTGLLSSLAMAVNIHFCTATTAWLTMVCRRL